MCAPHATAWMLSQGTTCRAHLFVCLLVCLFIYFYMYESTWLSYVHIYVETRGQSQVVLFSRSHRPFLLKQGLSLELAAHRLKQADCPVSPRDPAVSVYQHLPYRPSSLHQLFMWVGYRSSWTQRYHLSPDNASFVSHFSFCCAWDQTYILRHARQVLLTLMIVHL